MAKTRKNLIGCDTCEVWMYADPDEELPCDQCLLDQKEIADKFCIQREVA